MNHPSWGLFPKVETERFTNLESRFSHLPKSASWLLPRGLGRSYGDSCLNDGGLLVGTERLDHYIAFDSDQGILRCEAGVSFDEILKLIVPKGWFLPVTPGTKFVTVAGAIANDVHGKNHHISGNFGHHVMQFELLRSDGSKIICSPNENIEFFDSTIGGLGLTGLITWAEFKLKKISSSYIDQEQIQFRSLKDFFSLSHESEKDFEYTVAWVDCVNTKDDVRGIFIRGNHSKNTQDLSIHRDPGIKTIPFYFPEIALNHFSVKAFNKLYFHKNLSSIKNNTVHYDPFFYPLDSIHHWNRIYGKRGFLQYQLVVPFKQDSGKALEEIFQILQKSQMGSFLAVLKTFGSIASTGWMSFPQEGVTLALDFANYGDRLYRTLEQCDTIVREAKGRVYPAKDARMSKESFASFYPRASEFEKYVDPQFSSSFWRRVR